MSGPQILLGLAFAAACVYTVVGYPAKYGALTGRSRLYRTVGLFLFDLLLGLVILYTFLDFKKDATPLVSNVRSLTYILACFFLALSLVCIALLDWLESLVALRREQRTLMQEMIQTQQEQRAQRERRQEKPAQSDEDSANPGGSAAGGAG